MVGVILLEVGDVVNFPIAETFAMDICLFPEQSIDFFPPFFFLSFGLDLCEFKAICVEDILDLSILKLLKPMIIKVKLSVEVMKLAKLLLVSFDLKVNIFIKPAGPNKTLQLILIDSFPPLFNNFKDICGHILLLLLVSLLVAQTYQTLLPCILQPLGC